MNSLKTLFIVAVLGAVAYGVYVSINRNAETPAASEDAPVWPVAPQVQIPGPGAATPQFPPAGSGTDTAPRFSSSPTAAPGGGPSVADPPTAAIGATAAPPYGSPAHSAPPIGTRANGAPSTYSSNGDAGASSNVVPPSPAPGAGNPQTRPGHADQQGLSSNSLRSSQGLTSNPPAGRSPQTGAENKFAAFLQAIHLKLAEGRLAEAHLVLTALHDNPDVPPEEAQKVAKLLDQLAGTVIYSRQHLLEPPYRVRQGDTLERIAETYNVPGQLLARINGIRDPQRLEPGRELKVVRGPFSALIELDKYELTLMLGGRYAGRFPIGVGRDHPNLEGSYVVRDKIVNPVRYGQDITPGAGDPNNNPWGGFWIDLGNQVGIHGTDNPQNLHRIGGPGSVCLGDQDIDDIFGILSIGSRVVIRR